MDFSQIFSNPGIQKYLFDMSAGMSKGLADNPTNLNAAIGSGLGRAAQGQSEALGQEIEAQRQMDLQEKERVKTQNIMKQIMGDRSSLNSADGTSVSTGGLDLNNPDSMMKMGFALASSGSPQLMGFGEKLMAMGAASQKTQSDMWVSTTQNIGGKEIPVQINAKTGEVKPFSADIINGPKVTWNSDLRQYEDAYGNVVKKPSFSGGETQMSQPSQTVSSPISNFTDNTIQSQPTTVTKGKVPKLPNFFSDPNLTPGENADLRKQHTQAQLNLESKAAEKVMESNQKNIEEATNYFSPDNQQMIKSGNEATKSLLGDLEKQIPQAHNYPGSNIPKVQEFYKEWGVGGIPQLKATVDNLITTKIGQMKAAGVLSSGQLNTNVDVELQSKSIFDAMADEKTQREQLTRLKKDIVEADKLIAAKEKKFGSILGQQPTPTNITESTATNQPKSVKSGGKTYVLQPNGKYIEQ